MVSRSVRPLASGLHCVQAITSFGSARVGRRSGGQALKAPPPPPAPTSDIHGFFDVTFANDYITPRGLLVTNTGLTTQVLSGLVFDLYKDPRASSTT